MSPHLTDDQLISLLYGLGDAEGHVAGCAECGARWTAMRNTRAQIIDTPEIGGRRLAIERQQILERVERPARSSPWVPVAAAASLLVVATFLYQQPGIRQRGISKQVPATANIEPDTELFTDVYSMERDVEPKAAAPIRALFQETSFEQESK